MITGFGNNTSSALASDITANQTKFSVLPGAGDKFQRLLTTDNTNAGSPHSVYAKLTLTDSQGTVFEICHLTKVTGDSLTVIRGQEGTTAKGWSLNDIVANFATRGSEESFVQIEQLQGGDFTSATAGGTPNALTILLPSTYLNNASTDWALNTPLMIMPITANTGAVTIQVTLAGKVVGTFPAYKGNKAQLEKGDILAGVPFICAMDNAKKYFTVINPVNIYAALLRANNLSDVANAETARNNIGALAIEGGDVGYLNNAAHYGIKPSSWEGAGGFADQYTNAVAPFLIPYGYIAPKDVSSYAPIIKALIQTAGYGYGTAVSFGAVTSGTAKFAQAVIHVIGDSGISCQWFFDPTDGTFSAPGGNVVAGQGLYESGGTVRVYSSNNKPTKADVGLDAVGNYAAVQANGGQHNTGPHRIYIDWAADSKLYASVDDTDQGEFYTSKNPQPGQDLSGYMQQDSCRVAGFASADVNNPYMRHTPTDTVVELARVDWVNQNFLADAQRGSQALENGGFISQTDWEAPTGCFMTGIKNRADLGDSRTMGKYYRALMIKTASGGWRQVGN